MHATNEQMAIILAWIKHEGPASWYWSDSNDRYIMQYKDFNPIANLNHAALVEQRLAALGLELQYVSHIGRLNKDAHGASTMWRYITASAQTRCDAAWPTWQAWKEQGK
jgi:hypothetical protein